MFGAAAAAGADDEDKDDDEADDDRERGEYKTKLEGFLRQSWCPIL